MLWRNDNGPNPKPTQKMQLVDALLQCPTVSNRQTRDTVVNDLPVEIKHNIQRNADNRADVVNIVTTALNYRGGLESLIELVRMYEGPSIGMQEVDSVIAAVSEATSNLRIPSPVKPQQVEEPLNDREAKLLFISYSHLDKNYAHRLAESLEKKGFRVWISDRIEYGLEWPREIRTHLEKCSVFVLIMTPSTL